jgi:UPF0755 protein
MDRAPDDVSGSTYRATGARPPGQGWQRYEPGRGSGGGAAEPPRPGRSRRRRDRLVGYLLLAVVMLIVGGVYGYIDSLFSDGEVGGEVTVVVEEGSSLRAISETLAEQGVVKHARAFEIRAETDGYATRFMPGTYEFRVNEPYDILVATLLKGVKPRTVSVSIPEGSTLRQAADIVSGELARVSRQDYIAVARDDPPPFKLEGYKKGKTLEGMLFPATYEVLPKEASAESFVKTQLETFDAYFAKVDMTRAKAANLTEYDVVIIASIIDREIRLAKERRLAAAVIWNRLREDMRLQMCSTVQYALGKNKPVLSFEDLEIDSPYNTYKHDGLPPAPISNPSLAAMQAAADPADVDYLYFVAREDGSGGHYFSSTYEEFEADTAKAAANRE